MSKCNRTVCKNEGVFAHVDIVVAYDGRAAARYCEACAKLINEANRPMAGYALVPTTIEEVAEVLIAHLKEPLEFPADPEKWFAIVAERDCSVAELGQRLLGAIQSDRSVITASDVRAHRFK